MSDKKFNLERSLKRLEEIVSELEVETLTVDEMLKIYAEGKKLSQTCRKFLEEAEQKIEFISTD